MFRRFWVVDLSFLSGGGLFDCVFRAYAHFVLKVYIGYKCPNNGLSIVILSCLNNETFPNRKPVVLNFFGRSNLSNLLSLLLLYDIKMSRVGDGSTFSGLVI
jgi:hypothetical protein